MLLWWLLRETHCQIEKSKGKKNANGQKIRQNPLSSMAPKSPKLKRFSSLPKGWSPMTPNAPNVPLDLGFLTTPNYDSNWDAEYSEKFIICYEIKLDFNMIYQSLCAPE